MQQAPKYGKIELINHKDEVTTFEDCGMFITGEILVIVIDINDSIQNTQTSRGIIHKMENIKEYKTYQS